MGTATSAGTGMFRVKIMPIPATAITASAPSGVTRRSATDAHISSDHPMARHISGSFGTEKTGTRLPTASAAASATSRNSMRPSLDQRKSFMMRLAYVAAVGQFNPHGRLLFYPGSPALAMTQARAQDRLRLFELHPADFESLQRTFDREQERVQVRRADGFGALKGLLPPPSRRAVVLIDPPYEVKDDYRRVVDTLRDALRRFPTGTFAVWYPMLSRTEARMLPERLAELGAESWLDVRLAVRSPARDGFGMFGSGLYVVNPPWLLPERLEKTLPWLVEHLGQDEGAGFDLEHHIE